MVEEHIIVKFVKKELGMYQFNDNTLIHGISFDFWKMESIFKNGILSKNEALKLGINYSRNYHGKNNDDYISMIRYIYVNDEDINGAYNLYVKDGIGLIVEDTPYIYDKGVLEFHRSDEVYVKDRVSPKNIKGIILNEEILKKDISELKVLPINSVSYVYIKHICDNIIEYLKDYNYLVSNDEYNNYLRKLYFISGIYREVTNSESKKALKEEFRKALLELNKFMAENYKEAFCKVLGKNDISVFDIISYINDKYLGVPFYYDGHDKML